MGVGDMRVSGTCILGEVFSAQSRAKIVTPQKYFVLPQYRLHSDLSKEAYKDSFRTELFRTNLVREVF